MANLAITYKIKTPLTWGSFLNRLAQETVNYLKLKKDLEISLVFVSPQKIREYNRIYRQKDMITDVLSFSEVNEILICLSQAKKQAKENKLSVKNEVGWLFVHGILHLLGKTHESRVKLQKMIKIQDEILLKINKSD